MQTQERPTQTSTYRPSRSRGPWIAAIAFAVVAALIGASALLLGNGEPPVDTTSPTTTTVAPPTTTAGVTTTLDADAEWNSIPLLTRQGEPGEKRTNGFRPEYRFTVPAGWQPIDGGGDIWVIGTIEAEDPPIDIAVMRPDLGTVQETVDAILEAGQPEAQPAILDATIDGASGVMFSFQPGELSSRLTFNAHIYPFDSEWNQTIYVVDVDGLTVVIGIRSYFDLPDSALDDPLAVVRSIVWRDALP